jgi:hypothetical protein
MESQKKGQILKAVVIKLEGILQKSENQKVKKNFNKRLNRFEKFTANKKKFTSFYIYDYHFNLNNLC